MKKIVSVDFYAQFGFLKKPDINDGIYLTYNCLHKPALQGILGAILGFGGYSLEGEMEENQIPEYREKLGGIRIGISPIKSSNGNFKKDVIRFTNTVGYANVIVKKKQQIPSTLIINEQTLIKPSYRVFIELDINNEIESKLDLCLKNQEAEYIPYLGKNDHQLWWENYVEWNIKDTDYIPEKEYNLDSIFLKPYEDEKLLKSQRRVSLGDSKEKFAYLERLPKGWHKALPHYELGEFLYTNYQLQPEAKLSGLVKIYNVQRGNYVIQLF
jgi:CRISPR-associated protein Cas5h